MPSVQNVPQVRGIPDIDIYFAEWINKSLNRNPELARKINFTYQINITRNGNTFSSWVLDLSNGKGSLYRDPNHGVKCSVTLDESDLFKALEDKSHWRALFIKRKMALKGPRVALEKLQQFWIEADNNRQEARVEISNTNEHKALFDSIIANGFKSDIIFYTLKNRMHEEVDIVKMLSGIMQFDITKDGKKSVWTIDFTRPLGQNVYPGPPKDKPVCILIMDDESFAKMMVNKFHPQKAFMMGKLRVKGQILAIYKLFTVWIDSAFRKKRAPELPYIADIIFSSELIPGLKSDIMVFQTIQRLVKLPQLCQEPGGIYHFHITKDGKTVSKWKLDFTINKACGVFSRLPLDSVSSAQSLITIDDEDFVLLVANKLNVEQAMSSSRIKGDIGLASKLAKIFQMPIINSKL